MNNNNNYHAIKSEEVVRLLDVDPKKGLSSDEVIRRRALYGPNTITISQEKSSWRILYDQSKSLLILLLYGAAALSFIFNEYAEGVAILVAVIINISIGFWAESKALKSMAALRNMGRSTTKVRRDGAQKLVVDEEIVPGDTIVLDAGDIVTADIRLISEGNLQCNESLLTGESIPVSKQIDVVAEDAALHDRTNMAYKGTTITRGNSIGIVVGTAKQTQLGEISTLTKEATGTVSPLEQRLQKLSEQLLVAVLIIGILVMIAGIIDGRDILLMVKTSIALTVAAIPEGLPIVATLALARGMWKLAKHNALIKSLSAVETLGSVNIIFTDKTGTLTENEMTASTLIVPEGGDQNNFESPGEIGKRALRVCSLCYSGADPDHLNDPMESAIVKAASMAEFSPKIVEASFPRLREEAFDPDIRMMATLHKNNEKYFYLVKGAPESVLYSSDHIAHKGGETLLSEQQRRDWINQTEKLASEGLRILALAEKKSDTANEDPYTGLTFLGLIGLLDPPRKDVKDAITAAQEAGIRVIMVTGDNPVTSMNIASAVGIDGAMNNQTIEGNMMDAPDKLDASARQKILSAGVFARMSPRQKLNLIDLYQQGDAVVAMTGDGINDAPALKKADVGIAMGKRGTDVAKEAAEMILKDDSFASIVVAIQQGRIIYANIRKFVIYLLSCNLSEVMVVLICMLAGLPLPLLPLQILFLNLITDVFPALALGLGKGDTEILQRPPRLKSEELLSARHWQAIIYYAVLMTVSVIAAFYWGLNQPGQGDYYAVTIAFLTLAFSQLWHVFNMRSRKTSIIDNQVTRNPYVWAAILFCIILIALAIVLDPFADVLHISTLDFNGWVVVIVASFLPLVLGQFIKSLPDQS